MTHQTIEQAVDELSKDWLFAGDEPKEDDFGIHKEFKDFLRTALQAQRDAGAEDVKQVLITAMGMQAENMQRQALGQSMAYTEEDFLALTPPTK